MAEAIVSVALEQLISVTSKQIEKEVRLVVGVEEEVRKIRSNLEAIQAELIDAEQKQVREKAVRRWLDQLKDTSYDMDDVLDEWNTAIMKLQIEGDETNGAAVSKKKVCSFFPSCFGIKQVVLRHDIAVKIREINKKIDAIAEEKNKFQFNAIQATGKSERVPSVALVDESEICGRVDEKNTLIAKLLDKNRGEPKGLDIFSIVGMGGIGKTTLAQFAYNDNEVMKSFNKRIWVCVSDPFDELRIAKAVIEALQGAPCDLIEFNSLIEKIHDSIRGKKFLLVLDDVWTEDSNKWEPFHHCLKNGLIGSKILITTRKMSVARMVGSVDIMNIMELPENECWSLFSRLAFFGRSHRECQKLEEIGKEIVGKCKGLPLAAKTIGSLLRFKKTREEWQLILQSDMWKVEEIEKGLFSPLLLSYNDLPFMIRRCFSYCAIFPKDIRINKDKLIKLWMAQGYLGLEKNIEMEIVGQEYFEHLAARSFFQEFEKDDDDNVTSCKMHDVVHDFAQFMSKNECFSVEVSGAQDPNSSHEKVCHSMLVLKQGASFPKSICSVKKLRSLLVGCENWFHSLQSDVLQMLFSELTCLRALIFETEGYRGFIKEIPKEIGKLIHLRYLNLSNQEMEELPSTLCELYNLQTLDISSCGELKDLPQGIGKLINLRHLINDYTRSLTHMPIGIKRLTCLRTLNEFVLIDGDDARDGKAATLECLKDLNHLQGELEIKGLGNVTNVSEAKRIQVLKNKKILLNLKLRFNKDGEGKMINKDEELLLEALQPPPNLEKLKIELYRGNTFPSAWMMTLTKLKELSLFGCSNCEYLPPLGKLPSLESLSIADMDNVKRVGNEFWGIERNHISSSSSLVTLFPQLKSLTFASMREWEEWDYIITSKGDEEDDITIMPCLASLSIGWCFKLKAVPDSLLRRKTLKELKIDGCFILHKRYKMETGEDWPKISHIPNIQIDLQYVQGGLLC